MNPSKHFYANKLFPSVGRIESKSIDDGGNTASGQQNYESLARRVGWLDIQGQECSKEGGVVMLEWLGFNVCLDASGSSEHSG